MNQVPKKVRRCTWPRNELAIRYHDEEWGVPVDDDHAYFELLTLEGAQAGLSWDTILAKREHYREVFAGFDPARVARFDRRRIERLLRDPGIVRNRLKVESTVGNARAFLELQDREGSFDRWIRGFVGEPPRRTSARKVADLPARTEVSDALSKELRRRGFRFVGSTICYAFMQATGRVNDHTVGCFRRGEVS